MSTAEIIAWLDSDEGLEWSRSRPQCSFYDLPDMDETAQGPGDSDEDPTGRPPVTGKIAATREGVA